VNRKVIDRCVTELQSADEQITRELEFCSESNESLRDAVTDFKSSSMRHNFIFSGILEDWGEDMEALLQDFLQR
jgi:hypothetical protein